MHGLSKLILKILKICSRLLNSLRFENYLMSARNQPIFSCPNGCTEQFILNVIVLGMYNFDRKAEICPLYSMGFPVAPWGYTVLGTSEISFDKRFYDRKSLLFS